MHYISSNGTKFLVAESEYKPLSSKKNKREKKLKKLEKKFSEGLGKFLIQPKLQVLVKFASLNLSTCSK